MSAARPPISAEAIERLKAAVGRAGYLDDPADMAPYCTSWRDNWVGRVPLVLRPQSTQEVAAIVQHLRRAWRRHRPPGRQHRADRRRPAARRHERGDRLHLAPEARPRDRHRQRHHHRRGGRGPEGDPERRRPRRPAVPAEPRRRGLLPDRRQHLDQRRRRAGAALRQYAQPRAGPRGGPARRQRLERPARPAQGQHRLRHEAALHRRRRHARHRHRRGAAAVPQADRQRDRLDRASSLPQPPWRCWASCAPAWATRSRPSS